MNNVIDCICRNLPTNKIYVTTISCKDIQFLVIGMDNVDSDIPVVYAKKEDTMALFTIACNLIKEIIIIP